MAYISMHYFIVCKSEGWFTLAIYYTLMPAGIAFPYWSSAKIDLVILSKKNLLANFQQLLLSTKCHSIWTVRNYHKTLSLSTFLMYKRQTAVTDMSLFYMSSFCTSQLVTCAIRNIFSWRLVLNTQSRYSLADWYPMTELTKPPHYQKALTLGKKYHILQERKIILSVHPPFCKETQHMATVTQPLYCLNPGRFTQLLWMVFRMWLYKPVWAEGGLCLHVPFYSIRSCVLPVFSGFHLYDSLTETLRSSCLRIAQPLQNKLQKPTVFSSWLIMQLLFKHKSILLNDFCHTFRFWWNSILRIPIQIKSDWGLI